MIVRSIRKFWTGSIRRQLIIGIALIQAVLMTIFIVDLVERQRTFLYDQEVAKTGSLAGTLAANSTSWVLSNDVIGLEEVVQSLAHYPGVQYVMVLSPVGRVLAHTQITRVGQYVTDRVSLSLIGSEAVERVLVSEGVFVDTAQPIMANGRHIGWARVAIRNADVITNLSAVTRDGIIYTLLAIMIGTLFAYFMAKGLTSGLHQLVEVANKLRLGERDQRADVQRDDEVGALAHAFNGMADRILNRATEMRDSHANMEVMVDGRTEQLKETAAKTQKQNKRTVARR